METCLGIVFTTLYHENIVKLSDIVNLLSYAPAKILGINNNGIKIPGEDLGKVGYAYTWWTKELSAAGKKINGFWANGWGGQKIMVLPEIKTVIVFTGGNFNSKVQNLKILEKYIFPSIK